MVWKNDEEKPDKGHLSPSVSGTEEGEKVGVILLFKMDRVMAVCEEIGIES